MLPELSNPMRRLGGGLTLRNAGTSHSFNANAHGVEMKRKTIQIMDRAGILMAVTFLARN
jgi:hypothetical protein